MHTLDFLFFYNMKQYCVELSLFTIQNLELKSSTMLYQLIENKNPLAGYIFTLNSVVGPILFIITANTAITACLFGLQVSKIFVYSDTVF